MPLLFSYSSALDTGKAWQNNEDALLVDPALSLCLLADGMGGYNAGEIASELAIQTFHKEFREWVSQLSSAPTVAQVQQSLIRAAQQANHAVYLAAQTIPEYNGMGTTLVAALLGREQVWVGHLGDSRAYRWRAGQLEQLSRDHSLLQEQIDAGLLSPEEALYATHRNLVTRAVGVEPEVVLDVTEHRLQAHDLLLLCSDGLSDMLTDFRIAEVLRLHQNIEAAARALVEAANAAGGRDNIAVVLVRATAE